MIEFKNLSHFSQFLGQEIGVSGWRELAQSDLCRFAELTGDDQWIHLDAERTRRELGTPPVAHGYLVLSLLPRFIYDVFSIGSAKRMINYGSNKVRFIAPVHAGARVRGRVRLDRGVAEADMMRAHLGVTVEIEGQGKPALHAEVISLIYE